MTANRKRCRWGWGLVAVILLTSLAVSVQILQRPDGVAATNEPIHKGKTLSAWLLEASNVPDNTDSGLNAIRDIGPSAVPYLMRAFREGKLPGRVRRIDRDVEPWEIQERAAEALKALGPAAAAAVPGLIECLKDNDKKVRSEAAEILGKTGVASKPARDALLSALDDEDVAYHAANALGVLGRNDTNVVLELMGIAKSGRKPAAYWAAVSFVRLGAKSKPALPVLIELISHPAPDSDWQAVKAIGMIGPDAAQAVPALAKVFDIGGPWARKCAVISLGRIGPAARAVIPKLQDRLDEEESNYTRADVARALWRIDRDLSRASLLAALEIVEDELRAAASEEGISHGLTSALGLLGELGTNALLALPVVTKAIQLNEPHVQLCAAWAAWQIDPSQTHMTTEVLQRLADVKNYALENFRSLNFLAESKRERESYHIRIAAVAMLWQIEPESKIVLRPIMMHLLTQWHHWTSMKSIIPENQTMQPVLQELLSDAACTDMHPLLEEVLEQVMGADAERW